ncbi:MAG TPA: serine/threonine-protein kinase [Humisphaera sp.]
MDVVQRARIRSLFDQATDLEPADRPAFLDRACGSVDPHVRQEVEALLSAADAAGRFLATPELDGPRLAGPASASWTAGDGRAAPAAPADGRGDDAVRPGARLGPYVVVRTLGRGGYGVVVLARRAPEENDGSSAPSADAGLVAVKVLRPGMDSDEVLARFRLEHRALAAMDHPNVARVFGAGATPAGRPFFAMEFVDGLPLTDHCRSRGLGLAERLRLFADVCAGVQHAHQKGVVHRDLKPANVLVAEADGRAVPKVIDFGVAKAVAPDDGDGGAANPAFTAVSTLVPGPLGTPQYMSPEQVAEVPTDVDTRADVYALGAVLYELLADEPAFDAEALRAAGPAGVRRAIAEDDPPPPSERLSAAARAPDADGGEAESLVARARLVRGELDWVVGRAMEKDRARRYPTADALADDVRRFLRDEPVWARPPTPAARVRKFVRRHRGPVLAGSAVGVALVAGLGGTTVGLVQARHERDAARAAEGAAAAARKQADEQRAVAVANEARARDEADRAFKSRAYLYQMLVPPGSGGDRRPPPRAVLDFVAERADKVPPGSAGPDAELALRVALGKGYLDHGAAKEAAAQYALAKAAALAAYGPSHVEYASAAHNAAVPLLMLKQYAAAEPLLREALAAYRRAAPAGVMIRVPVLQNLGLMLVMTDRPGDAEPPLREALDGVSAAQGERHPRTAHAKRMLADALAAAGQDAEAERLRREADEVDPRR